MELLIEEFVHQQNLSRFRTLLAETKDEPRRQLLSKLLVAEEQSAPCSSTAQNVGRSYDHGHAGSASLAVSGRDPLHR
jgi:hypothetical protein